MMIFPGELVLSGTFWGEEKESKKTFTRISKIGTEKWDIDLLISF